MLLCREVGTARKGGRVSHRIQGAWGEKCTSGVNKEIDRLTYLKITGWATEANSGGMENFKNEKFVWV